MCVLEQDAEESIVSWSVRDEEVLYLVCSYLWEATYVGGLLVHPLAAFPVPLVRVEKG